MKSDEQVQIIGNGKPRFAPKATKGETVGVIQHEKNLANGVKDDQNIGETKGGKLSGTELKKRKQAEKAARRAQVKESKQQTDDRNPKATIKPESRQETKIKGSKKPSSTPTAAQAPSIEHPPHHHRKGSIQKALHSKPQILADSPLPEPPKHDRRVALFGHLYGKEARRSSIAGANKDVHPVVLALGLQMSNYVICGSSARCVAMLLVLKRVRLLLLPRMHTSNPVSF